MTTNKLTQQDVYLPTASLADNWLGEKYLFLGHHGTPQPPVML